MLLIISSLFILRNVSNCPAYEFCVPSSHIADDLTATLPNFNLLYILYMSSLFSFDVQTNPFGTLNPNFISSPKLAALPPTSSTSFLLISSNLYIILIPT